LSRRRDLPSFQLDKRTARAVAAGHPWVWADALEGRRPPAGSEVVLLDSVGAFCARGLAGDPASTGPAVRVLTRDDRAPDLHKLVFRRIAEAARLRTRTVAPGTDAFRLLHGEGDGLPGVVVDRYGPALVLRPDDDAMWRPHRQRLLEALRSEGPRDAAAILLRTKDGSRELLWGKRDVHEVVVTEEGRRFLVRPGHGQKTGFFCDQRPTRTLVQSLTRPGDRSLNLFSYTGGFSVAMALGGAERVTSVDLSPPILADVAHNLSLNGADPDAHEQVPADAFDWLSATATARDRPAYDLVVCDPPALARNKGQLEAAGRAYRRLHAGISSLLAPGGILVTCSCTARITEPDLLAAAADGLARGGRRITRILARGGAGPDHPIPPGFPEGSYLKCLTLAIQ